MSMDANIEPDVYVMTRAWYEVVPTGAQAAVAIRMLAELSSSDHPGALDVLSKDIYVEDVNPGAETESGRDDQVLWFTVEENPEKRPALMECT